MGDGRHPDLRHNGIHGVYERRQPLGPPTTRPASSEHGRATAQARVLYSTTGRNTAGSIMLTAPMSIM